LALFPVLQHLIFGFRERRHEIIHYFDEKATTQYFRRYFPVLAARNNFDPEREFSKFYDERFGFRVYFLPFIIFMTTLLVAVWVTVGATFGTVGGVSVPDSLRKEVIAAAIAGAYLWVFIDLLGRYRTRDIVPSALYQAALRFAIAVPLAYALGSFFNSTIQTAIAFMLGAFPTTTLMLLMRRLVGQKIGLGYEAKTEKYELEKIQGINTALAEKFGELGISTLLQLAYEDPIQLTMRINLPFRDIIDVMSQALAALYMTNLDVYRRYLVRSSIDAGVLYKQLQDNEKPQVKKLARAQLEAIAADLKMSPEVLEKILFEVYSDTANAFFMSLPW
jgi:hypothetical protein